MKPQVRLLPFRGFWLMASACLIAAVAAAADKPSYIQIPLKGPAAGKAWEVCATGNVKVSAETIRDSATDGPITRMSFQKTGEERRIAALEGTPGGSIEGAKVLALRCRLQLREGSPPPVAMVVFEKDGGAWYRITRKAVPTDGFGDVRIPLTGPFNRALFASDKDETVRWDQVDRVWVALLLDGPATGSLDVSRAVFTNEPFRPTGPLAVGGAWEAGQDPAVRAQISSPKGTADGKPQMKYTFEMPGGRHMYAIPRVAVNVDELDGYSGLKFTYRAELPAGIDGLLVMLMEASGTQYYADPAPPAAADWKTVTIPFSTFRRGGWSPDENDRLDLNEVRHVAIGMHGTAKPAHASGTITVTDVQFVP